MNPVRRVNSPNGTWSQRAEEVGEQISHVPQQLGGCVEERPVTSLLAAFGVGVVAGAGLISLYYSCCSQPASVTDSYTQRIADALRDVMPRSMMSR